MSGKVKYYQEYTTTTSVFGLVVITVITVIIRSCNRRHSTGAEILYYEQDRNAFSARDLRHFFWIAATKSITLFLSLSETRVAF